VSILRSILRRIGGRGLAQPPSFPTEVEGLLVRLRGEGFSLPRPELIFQAMTHQSWINERRLRAEDDYQRLEFLGDSVLELIIRRYLFVTCPDEQEGDLSMRKSMMVRKGFIGQLAKGMGLASHILMGQGEAATGGRTKPSILADCFESLLGGLFLNDGFTVVEKWFLASFGESLRQVTLQPKAKSSKNSIQEVVQNRFGTLPRYKVLEEKGPEHKKIFSVGLYIGQTLYGVGQGKSKKSAQEAAARRSLEELEKESAKATS
jgi:ribonuclease-3